jgi:hypothetical protein
MVSLFKETAMAKAPIQDAYIDELGVGIYLVKWFNPKTSEWRSEKYCTGYAEARLGLLSRRKNGDAAFKNIKVSRISKGTY